MVALIFLFFNLVASLFKSKSRLEAENAALRHQLTVLQGKVRGRVQFLTAIVCSSSSCIVGFRRSSRPLRSSGPRPSCAGIVLGFAGTGAGDHAAWEAGRKSMRNCRR
jgi:hypothetical protein